MILVNPYAFGSNLPTLTGTTYEDIQTGPTDAVCNLTFNSNGTLSSNVTGTVTGQWLATPDSVQAALYELEAVIFSGTALDATGTTAAASGTWRDLASNWTYGNKFTPSLGSKLTIVTFTIRRKSDLAVMTSANIGIKATVN